MRVGLATIEHGRQDHLLRQAEGVRRLAGLDRYLVVAMDASTPPAGAEVLYLPDADPDRLPLAAARNAAVRALDDCDLVVLLDVDCIPGPELLRAYVAAAEQVRLAASVLMGPITWLSATASSAPIGREMRAWVSDKRGFPETGIALEARPELFWSLSCAVSPRTHHRIGGFDEGFCGWGAEDTDYGRRVDAAGIQLWKVADAWAYHQFHQPMRQTPAQIAAFVANAERFRARWGDWPAPDVLDQLSRDSLIRWLPSEPGIEVTAGRQDVSSAHRAEPARSCPGPGEASARRHRLRCP